ncbi:MAG: ABC transporter ATP-binding protein [Parvibaculaceae bacterium]
MKALSFRGVTKRFGDTLAVNDVSLDVDAGEFVSLLGPSGCGKTTLLRILAGFTKAHAGTVSIDGKQIDPLPPSRRGLGFVFQSYALFPTQTVAQNIGFALSIRRDPPQEIAKRVAELCEIVQLTGKQDHYPHELSGGQQQRVALARALAPKPAIMLMDEPLSALDAKIRAHLRAEIRAIVEQLGITTVYVTHDQEEALTMSDRIAVMDGGVIRQVGTPMEIYHRPADSFVAGFIGDSNMLAARAMGGRVVIASDVEPVETLGSPLPECDCVLCVRPEHIELHRPSEASRAPIGTIRNVSFMGQLVRAHILTAEGSLLVADAWSAEWEANRFTVGDRVAWRIRSGRALAFRRDSHSAGVPS